MHYVYSPIDYINGVFEKDVNNEMEGGGRCERETWLSFILVAVFFS